MWWEYRAGRHDWRPGTRGINTEALLYRIETAKILASVSHLPICIVEGEKDTDCLFNLGIPATCNAHGAAAPGQAPKWLKSHSLQLDGFDICVFNDADPSGLAHAEAVVALSRGLARSIRRIDHALHFPGTKDIADWVKYGGSRQDLLDFIEGAPCP
jgi:DNA primase